MCVATAMRRYAVVVVSVVGMVVADRRLRWGGRTESSVMHRRPGRAQVQHDVGRIAVSTRPQRTHALPVRLL